MNTWVKRLLVLGVVASAPLLMAPEDPICLDCALNKFSGTLTANGTVSYSAVVEAGVRYEGALYPTASGVSLSMPTNATNLNCSTSDDNTFCCYTAETSGQVTYKVTTGANAASFSLYHLKCTGE